MFPASHSLCERCGYAIQGLAPDASCPECGLSIDESHPRHRSGPPWAYRMTLSRYLGVWITLHANPRRFFRRLSLTGSNWPARVILITVATLVWAGAAALTWLALGRSPLLACGVGIFAGQLVVALSYVEILGVSWFSKRRGWRVPLWLAERVVGYASIGWAYTLVLAAGMALTIDLLPLADWATRFGRYAWIALPLGAMLALVVTLQPFEWLVWLGVRQVKFGNRPAAPTRSTPRGRKTERI